MESQLKPFEGGYCNSLTQYSRRVTIPVRVGDVIIGGDNPIVVQSMTTVDTMDTQGSVEQCIRMIDSGCQLIRITAPSLKEAENLRNIKEELRKRGYNTPLVADIHFTPNAAELAAKIVEKVRAASEDNLVLMDSNIVEVNKAVKEVFFRLDILNLYYETLNT